MTPLRDWILLEQFDIASEEEKDSGIVLIRSDFNLFNFEDESRIQSIVRKEKQHKGRVFKAGAKCGFVKEGDTVVYQKFSEASMVEVDGKKYALVKEKSVLCKEGLNGFIAAPNQVVVKIRKEDVEAIYKKKIKRDDGTWTELFLTVKVDSVDERRATLFVSTGEIMSVGAGVENVQPGDIGIIDYLADNDETIIVGYEGEDKLIVIQATTEYVSKDHVVYASRKTPKDTVVERKGDFDLISQLLGVVRGDEIISMAPYVFLAHEKNVVQRKTLIGIEYNETQIIYQRKVLSVPASSNVMPRVKKDDSVLVHDKDVFEVMLGPRKVQCVVDQDVIAIGDLMQKTADLPV